MDGTVLVADDDRTIRTVLTQALTRAGCKVHATSSLTTLMRWVSEGIGDVVISDVVMPDGNGLEMLPKIAAERPELPVIVISAQNTIMTAIQASEAKAFDYLPKPFDLPDLMKRTARALERRAKTRKPDTLVARKQDLPLVGQTPVMQTLYKMVAQIVNTNLAVFITGESGTGKSLMARAIHDLSDRRGLPFVTVAESDIQDATGAKEVLERAKSGTVLFDAVGSFSPETQARMTGMVDAAGELGPRFMATSQSSAAQGGLRDDLFYRLNGALVQMPSLRARIDDIELLAEHFLGLAMQGGSSPHGLSQSAIDMMRAYTWPGNVRQLENTMRQLALTSQGPEISRKEIEQVLNQTMAMAPDAGIGVGDSHRLADSVAQHLQRYFDLHGDILPPSGLHARIMREVERPLIELALDVTGGNQAKCADLLGINRNTLRKKLTELDIRVTRRRKLM